MAAFGFGVAVAGLAWFAPVSGVVRALLAANGFFVVYLALMARLALQSGPADLRRHAEADDEGIVLIVALALLAVGVSLAAIFAVLNGKGGGLETGLALAAVPLGWAMIQTLAAFRYAYLYYATRPVGGLRFAGGGDPGVTEFLYLAFGIGMTAQVADVVVTSALLRRTVLVHAVGAFFYNTVILALAVNAGLAIGGQ